MNYDWQKIRLKEIGSVCMCKRILKYQTNTEKGIPFYKIGTFGKKADAFISEELYKKYKDKYNYPEKGDILISAAGTLGETIVYDGKPAYFQDSNIVWLKHDSSKAINKFLLYVYAMKPWEVPESSTVPRLYNNNILNTYILLPPLPEQEKIAEILGTWDLAIEKLTALIEQKKLLKKGLMQRLLNFKKEYLKRFDEIFEDYSDKKHSDKDLLSATQENGVIPRRLLKGRVMSPEGSLDGYKLVQSGSFVISLRSFQGGLEYSDYEGIISPAYTVLKDKISINKCFYRYFFKSYNFIEKYLSIAVIGIRDGKQISYPDLQSVKIPYPPLSEQKAIADILSKADEEIDLLTRKLSALKEQKTGLMQQLLTGKIRVKVA